MDSDSHAPKTEPAEAPTSVPEQNPDRLFAAVGHAIAIWESSVEMGMAQLYSVFTKRPFESSAIIQFGTDGRVSSKRVTDLETAGRAYFFAAMTDEKNERNFAQIVMDLRVLLPVRHQIAHGSIWTIPVLDTDNVGPDGWVRPSEGHYWTAPWYAVESLRHNGQSYRFNAADIDVIASRYAAIGERIVAMAHEIAL